MSEFKACDVRGRAGEGIITPAGFASLGRALAAMADERGLDGPFVVAGDVRVSSAALRSALCDGLLAGGRKVFDCGTLPTPVFYFAIGHLGAVAGATVTASHNPPAYNGLKFILGEHPVTPDDLAALAARVRKGGGDGRSGGRCEPCEVMPAYGQHLLALCPRPLDGMRLVVDGGNGCYASSAPALLEGLGAAVDPLFCEPDGTFPGRSPNSALPKNLGALRERLGRGAHDLGIAFDGDGDRVSFVDETGVCIPCDTVIALLGADAVRAAAGGQVVCDIKVSSAVADVVAAAGGEVLLEKSGHAFIKDRVQRCGAVFGGEVSGHYFYPFLGGGDDGLYTAWRFADYLRRCGTTASAAVAAVPHYAITPDIRLPCEAGEAAALLARLALALAGEADLDRTDGLRALWPEGWALVRLSITEPAITFRFEGRSRSLRDTVVARFLATEPAWLGQVRAAIEAEGEVGAD